MSRSVVLLSSVALASSLIPAAFAGTITTFTDRASFTSAVGSVTEEGFGTSPFYPVSGGVITSATSLGGGYHTAPGVTYSTPVDSVTELAVDSCPSCGFDGVYLDSVAFSGEKGGALTATFDNDVTAVGFDTDNLGGSQESITINFATGSPYTNTLSVTSLATSFFGFESSSADITSVVIQYVNPGQYGFAVDNFTFATSSVAPTPEPSTLALFGLALPALGLLRRRVRN